mgnify:FL=1
MEQIDDQSMRMFTVVMPGNDVPNFLAWPCPFVAIAIENVANNDQQTQ